MLILFPESVQPGTTAIEIAKFIAWNRVGLGPGFSAGSCANAGRARSNRKDPAAHVAFWFPQAGRRMVSTN